MWLSLSKLACANLLGNWRRSTSTILSVAVAVVSIVLFEGYIHQAVKLSLDTFEKRNMLGQLLVLPQSEDDDPNAVFSSAEQEKVKQALAQALGVDVAVPFLATSGTVSNGKTQTIFTGFGYDIPAGVNMRQPVWGWNTTAGIPLGWHGQEVASDVVLGQALGRLLGCNVEKKEVFAIGVGGYEEKDRPFHCRAGFLRLNTTTVGGRANAATVHVAGLVDAAFHDLDLRYVMMPLATAQELRGQPDVSFYTVQVKPGANIETVAAAINSQLKEAGQAAIVKPWTAHRFGDYYNKTIAFMMFLRNFVVTVMVLIAGLSVFSTAIKSVEERTREAGTFRSMGFMPGQVTRLFLLEQAFLLAIAVSVGGLVAFGISTGLNSLRLLYEIGTLSEPVPFNIAITWSILLSGFVLVAGVGMVACYAAARRMQRMSITACLRHV